MTSHETQPDGTQPEGYESDGTQPEATADGTTADGTKAKPAVQPVMSAAPALVPIPDFAGMTVQAAVNFAPTLFEIRCCVEIDPCADPHVPAQCGEPDDHLQKIIIRNHEACPPNTLVVAPHLVGVYIN